MKKKITRIFIPFLLLFLVSCGGGIMPVTISSTPNGADIKADGENKGTTPKTIFLNENSHTIRVEQNGYQSQSQMVYPKTTMTFFGFVFFPFWILDPEWKFEPNNLHFTLEQNK